MISKPALPPRAGYVERVDAAGRHYYEPTAETHRKLQEQEKVKALEDALAASDEVAVTLYESMSALEAASAQQDEAILGVYEMIST